MDIDGKTGTRREIGSCVVDLLDFFFTPGSLIRGINEIKREKNIESDFPAYVAMGIGEIIRGVAYTGATYSIYHVINDSFF